MLAQLILGQLVLCQLILGQLGGQGTARDAIQPSLLI